MKGVWRVLLLTCPDHHPPPAPAGARAPGPKSGRAVSEASATLVRVPEPAPTDRPPEAAHGLTMKGFWSGLTPPARWLLSTVAITHLGRGATLPFTIIYVTEVRDIALDTAGALMALIAVVALVTTAPTGVLIDRLGARLVMLTSTLVQLLAMVVLAFATSVPVFVLGFTLLGTSFGVSWPTVNALIASIVPPPLRTQYYGTNFALLNLGIGVGGVVAGLFVDVHRAWTFTAVFLADAVCMLIPLAVLLGPLRQVTGRAATPPSEDAAPASYLAILRRPVVAWVAVLTVISSAVGYGQMESGFPAFARQVSEVGTRTIGFAFAINTGVIVLLQFLTLRLIAGRRRTRVYMVLSLLWAAAWLLIGATGLVPGTWVAAFGVLFFHVLFGFGETMLQPSIPAMVNDLADDHESGRYNAATAAAFQIGAIAGPVLAGWLLDRRLAGGFVAFTVAGCLAMVVLARVIERFVPPGANGVPVAAGGAGSVGEGLSAGADAPLPVPGRAGSEPDQ